MYTLHFNLKKYLSDFQDAKSELSNLFQKRLEDGTDTVIFHINERSVTYTVYDNYYGFLSFEITDEQKLKILNFDKRYSEDLMNVFIEYVVNKDQKSTKKELKERYGNLYDEYNFVKTLSEEDRLDYKDNKSDLNSLISSLDNINDNIALDYQISCITFMFCEYICLRLDIKTEAIPGRVRGSSTGVKNVLDKYFFNNMVYDLEDTTERVFEKLSSLYFENSNSDQSIIEISDTESSKFKLFSLFEAIIKNNENINAPKILVTMNNSSIIYYGKEEVTISVSDNGEISSSFTPDRFDKIIYVEFKKAALLYNNKYYMILKFNSQRAIKIFEFIVSHKDIRYDLMQTNITNDLVPKIASDVKVSPSLVAKSLKLINHIELFLSLEDNGIKSETRTFIKGEQVPLEQYKLTEEIGFSAFNVEMQKLSLPFNGILKDEDLISSYLSADLSSLKKVATIFISEELRRLKRKPLPKINILITTNNDWFKLNFKSDDYSDEEVKAILSAYKKKKKYVRLKDDYLSLQDGDVAHALGILMEDFDFDGKTFEKKIPIYQVLKLQDNPLSVVSKDILKLFNEIKDYDNVKINVNENLYSILRPYQIKGVKWLTMLAKHNLGGILADDMGLGKTLEMISFLSQDKKEMPSLIITPKSLSYNWENEFKQWNPSQQVVVLSLDKDARRKIETEIKEDKNIIYIIPYDSLRSDLDYFKNITFNYCIIDEGQYISNAIAKKTKAIKEISAKHKFALTGTPIQNSLLDLWSIFDFIMPGYFRSLNQFKKTYGKLDIEEEDKKHLERIISPFILKRKKEDVLTELPGKTIEVKILSMSNEERKLYDANLIQTQKMMHEDSSRSLVLMLAALTRLRQICVDPSTFLEYNELSSKLEYTIETLIQATNKGHKVLVFSSFRQTLEHLEAELIKYNVSVEKITGETSAKKRVELADEFNKKDTIKVMLVSLKAGGTGLNLIGADIVIHLDPWWNIAAEEQASDRAYRIGQDKKVTVYKLVMKDTIEEKVIKLQEKKKNLAQIVDQNNNEKTTITDEDIRYLLS